MEKPSQVSHAPSNPAVQRKTWPPMPKCILHRLRSMEHHDDDWWAFRTETIKSSVPDMYTFQEGGYRVVQMSEWSKRCTPEEVLIVLQHWVNVGTLIVGPGWAFRPREDLDE